MQENNQLYKKIWIFGVILIAAVLLASCSGSSETQKESNAASETEAIVTAMPPTLTPTFTPAPPLVVLYAPQETEPQFTAYLEPVVRELATQSGMQFETKSVLEDADFDRNLKVVVLLPPQPDPASLAAAHPDVAFLSVGVPNVQPTSNLTVVGADGLRFDKQGFIAGYTAAVVTDDWRVGVISLEDTPEGKGASKGFTNGVVFFCGLCRPARPPFYEYPIFYLIPGAAGEVERQAAADYMVGSEVHTVYVFPGAGDDALYQYLADAGVHLIGGIDPPDGLADSWIATVTLDMKAAVAQAWSDMQAGDPGRSIPFPVVITNPNEDLFSIGRQNWVQETVDNLNNDMIDTGVDPNTGESK